MSAFPSASLSLSPQQQAVHVVVFGVMFALLASPKTITFVQGLVPKIRLSEMGVQLTPLGLFVHAAVYMLLALMFAYYAVQSGHCAL